MAASPQPKRVDWQEEVKITFDNHELGNFYDSFTPLEDPLSATLRSLDGGATLFLADDEAA